MSLLFGGAALYLVTFAFTRWRLFHTIAMPRLSATVVLALFLLATLVWELVWVVLGGVLNAVDSGVLPKTLRQVSEPGRRTTPRDDPRPRF